MVGTSRHGNSLPESLLRFSSSFVATLRLRLGTGSGLPNAGLFAFFVAVVSRALFARIGNKVQILVGRLTFRLSNFLNVELGHTAYRQKLFPILILLLKFKAGKLRFDCKLKNNSSGSFRIVISVEVDEENRIITARHYLVNA